MSGIVSSLVDSLSSAGSLVLRDSVHLVHEMHLQLKAGMADKANQSTLLSTAAG